jgi:hypothetical protein
MAKPATAKKTHCPVPIREHGNHSWGALCFFGMSQGHVFAAEKCKTISAHSYSFLGGHKLSLFKLENKVHWRIPDDWDISAVDVDTPARRTLK